MAYTDTMNVTGSLELVVKDATTGRVTRIERHHNLVVTQGRQAISLLIGGDVAAQAVTQIAVGENGTIPVLGDVTAPAGFTKAVTDTLYPGPDVQFTFSLETAEANGLVIREFGLLLADGSLFARTTPAPITKDNTIRVEGTWTIKF